MKYESNIYKNESEWLKHRGIGGSSASIILGLNQWSNEMELYKELKLKRVGSNTGTQSTLYGKKIEPLLRVLFILNFKGKYELYPHNPYQILNRLDKPYLTLSPDSLGKDITTGKEIAVEFKTHDVYSQKDLEEWTGQIPQNYHCQCLHYFIVKDDLELVILMGKLRFFKKNNDNEWTLDHEEIRYYFIYRDEVKDQVEYLENKETKWYEEHIIKGKMPSVKITL